jgi:hypothetical protein
MADWDDHIMICKDCANLDFDRISYGFKSSNLYRCRADGREHWIGDMASDCEDFTERPASAIIAAASGY